MNLHINLVFEKSENKKIDIPKNSWKIIMLFGNLNDCILAYKDSRLFLKLTIHHIFCKSF